ncbi:membrane dipeptidase [Pyruvatibacter sp.]|uniref:dipeptidase n=1 Tax=Pyruvatibacter sp. TaxID=1981328 RepID=UPI0032669AB8
MQSGAQRERSKLRRLNMVMEVMPRTPIELRVIAIASLLSANLLLSGCAAIIEFVDVTANGLPASHDPRLVSTHIPTKAELEFHDSLFIVDLHADSLLWGREIAQTGRHLDLEKMRAGNIALQVLSVVTKTPGFDVSKGCVPHDGLNSAALLAPLQGQPVANWFSTRNRALEQATRLRGEAELDIQSALFDLETSKDLWLIRTVQDLRRLLDARSQAVQRKPIGVVLAIEGVHWLGDREMTSSMIEQQVDEIFEAGFRMAALTHRFDNGLGGASEGCNGFGLTPQGRQVVREMVGRGIVVDAAHLSNQSFADLFEVETGPLVSSHGGVKASFNVSRNMSDDDIRGVVRSDGTIGVGFWPEAVGQRGTYVEAIGEAFEEALAVMFEKEFVTEMDAARLATNGRPYDPYEHISFGSDFDGAVTVPFSADRLAFLTTHLMRRTTATGDQLFPMEKIPLVAGLNACRVLAARMPSEKAVRPSPISVCRIH